MRRITEGELEWAMGLAPFSLPKLLRVGHADDTARNPAACIANRLAAVVNFGVHDHPAAEDGILGSHNRNVGQRDLVMGFSLIVRLDISKIARMPILTLGQAMLVSLRVIVPASAHSIGCGAVAILVNVKGVLLAGCQALKLGNHLHRVTFLSEVHHPVTLLAGRWVQNCHGI